MKGDDEGVGKVYRDKALIEKGLEKLRLIVSEKFTVEKGVNGVKCRESLQIGGMGEYKGGFKLLNTKDLQKWHGGCNR